MTSAGFSQTTINPPEGMPLDGYSPRNNIGVQDDLTAQALFLDDGRQKALILCADLIGLTTGLVARIRQEVVENTDLTHDAILIACSHTHSGPGLPEKSSDKMTVGYIDGLVHKMGVLAREAARNVSPIRIGYGCGQADLCHNRRVVDAQGKATNEWADHAHKHTGLVDKRVFVLKITDEAGAVKAVLVNYACHPVVMGMGSKMVSADYPGYMRRHLQEAFPGAKIMFTNAGGGNIDPYICTQNDFAEAEKMGVALGREVERVLGSITAEAADSIAVSRLLLQFEPHAKITAETGNEINMSDDRIRTEMQLMRIGDILIVTTPGELLIEIALRIKKESPCKKTLVFAYANGYIGYLPPDALVSQGGHEIRYAPSHKVEQPMMDGFKKLVSCV